MLRQSRDGWRQKGAPRTSSSVLRAQARASTDGHARTHWRTFVRDLRNKSPSFELALPLHFTSPDCSPPLGGAVEQEEQPSASLNLSDGRNLPSSRVLLSSLPLSLGRPGSFPVGDDRPHPSQTWIKTIAIHPCPHTLIRRNIFAEEISGTFWSKKRKIIVWNFVVVRIFFSIHRRSLHNSQAAGVGRERRREGKIMGSPGLSDDRCWGHFLSDELRSARNKRCRGLLSCATDRDYHPPPASGPRFLTTFVKRWVSFKLI